MELTREQALSLHRQMWTDMQKDLGDNPLIDERQSYKEGWCKEHFPTEEIDSNCFLCQYAMSKNAPCNECIIDWGCASCGSGAVTYAYSPISEILALPERVDE